MVEGRMLCSVMCAFHDEQYTEISINRSLTVSLSISARVYVFTATKERDRAVLTVFHAVSLAISLLVLNRVRGRRVDLPAGMAHSHQIYREILMYEKSLT